MVSDRFVSSNAPNKEEAAVQWSEKVAKSFHERSKWKQLKYSWNSSSTTYPQSLTTLRSQIAQ